MDYVRKNDDMDKFIAQEISKSRVLVYLTLLTDFIAIGIYIDEKYFSLNRILGAIAIITFIAERIIPLTYHNIPNKYSTTAFEKARHIKITKQIAFCSLISLILVILGTLFKNITIIIDTIIKIWTYISK